MKLYLVQHGDALPRDVDAARPLSDRGRRDVGRIADFLRRADVQVDSILHSGKTRAEQTATLIAGAMPRAAATGVLAGIAPNDPVEPVAAMLVSMQQDTLVAGHLPFLARLTGFLLTADADHEPVAFLPGSVVCLESGESGAWRINWMLRPELLENGA